MSPLHDPQTIDFSFAPDIQYSALKDKINKTIFFLVFLYIFIEYTQIKNKIKTEEVIKSQFNLDINLLIS